VDSGIVEDMDSDFDDEAETPIEATNQPSFSEVMRLNIKTLDLPKRLLRFVNMDKVL